MRIADSMRLAAALNSQARTAERLVNLTRQSSSGYRVEKPSHDPASYAAISVKDSRTTMMQARNDQATRARGDLQLAESTLDSVSQLLNQVHDLAVAMANPENDVATRKVAAQEVRDIRERLLGFANTRGEKGYLFAGTKTDTPPFDSNGTFQGNDSVINVEVAEGVFVAANASGSRAFTAAGGRDIMADLTALADALDADDADAINTMLGAVEQGHSQVVAARSTAGITVARLQSAADVASASLSAIKVARARMAEIDPVQVFSDLTYTRMAYERSLSVTNQILSMTSGVGQ